MSVLYVKQNFIYWFLIDWSNVKETNTNFLMYNVVYLEGCLYVDFFYFCFCGETNLTKLELLVMNHHMFEIFYKCIYIYILQRGKGIKIFINAMVLFVCSLCIWRIEDSYLNLCSYRVQRYLIFVWLEVLLHAILWWPLPRRFFSNTLYNLIACISCTYIDIWLDNLMKYKTYWYALGCSMEIIYNYNKIWG